MDMGDKETLVDFVTRAMRQFPADHYYLAIENHGNAVQGIAEDWSSEKDGKRDRLERANSTPRSRTSPTPWIASSTCWRMRRVSWARTRPRTTCATLRITSSSSPPSATPTRNRIPAICASPSSRPRQPARTWAT
ncbi:MAG: hypothetical protein R2838_00580 [Caldilineaceae bacterium]